MNVVPLRPGDAANRQNGVELAIIVLLSDPLAAQQLAEQLDSALEKDSRAVVALPPVLGSDFFADAGAQAELDIWWAETVPRDARPLYIVEHDAAVAEWVTSVDGHFLMRCAGADEAKVYSGNASVTTVVLADIDRLAAVALQLRRGERPDSEGHAPRARTKAPRRRGNAAFRRARLRAKDELAATNHMSDDHTVAAEPRGSAALFVGDVGYVEDESSETMHPASLIDDMIRILTEALQKLEDLRRREPDQAVASSA